MINPDIQSWVRINLQNNRLGFSTPPAIVQTIEHSIVQKACQATFWEVTPRAYRFADGLIQDLVERELWKL